MLAADFSAARASSKKTCRNPAARAPRSDFVVSLRPASRKILSISASACARVGANDGAKYVSVRFLNGPCIAPVDLRSLRIEALLLRIELGIFFSRADLDRPLVPAAVSASSSFDGLHSLAI